VHERPIDRSIDRAATSIVFRGMTIRRGARAARHSIIALVQFPLHFSCFAFLILVLDAGRVNATE